MIPQVMRNWFHSEKGGAWWIAMIAATALLLMGKISPEQWADVVGWSTGGYMVGKGLAGRKANGASGGASPP